MSIALARFVLDSKQLGRGRNSSGSAPEPLTSETLTKEIDDASASFSETFEQLLPEEPNAANEVRQHCLGEARVFRRVKWRLWREKLLN
jgi:hypothetical protein